MYVWMYIYLNVHIYVQKTAQNRPKTKNQKIRESFPPKARLPQPVTRGHEWGGRATDHVGAGHTPTLQCDAPRGWSISPERLPLQRFSARLCRPQWVEAKR